jgi:hypothetical protein
MFENDDGGLRRRSTMLGAGVGALGLVALLAPGPVARAFGVPTSPVALAVVRSLGTREVVMGAMLCSAALHGGKLRPQLLARLLTDATDTLVMGGLLVTGHGNRLIAAIGALAAGATVQDLLLWRAAGAAADVDSDLADFAPLTERDLPL